MFAKLIVNTSLFTVKSVLKWVAPKTKNKVDDKIVEKFEEIRSVIKKAL